MSPTPPLDTNHLRRDVRDFLSAELEAGGFIPRCDAWLQGFSPEFSKRLGARGWLGITWPRRYGGREASAAARFVVLEELLAAGAPVAAHWMAERQTGPLLLRYGTDAQRDRLLPGIARGEVYVSIGLSEPDSGSDLASVSTRAVPRGDGWAVSGQKVWTSHAHRTHYLVTLVRTSHDPDDRHAGLTQLLIPLDAPGVTVRPIRTINDQPDFCEVFLDEVQVPAEGLIGRVGDGWEQVTSELAHERSGPERFLSPYPLLAAFVDQAQPDVAIERDLGSLVASLWALRALSASLTRQLDEPEGAVLTIEAAFVKDRGTLFEQRVVDVVRQYAVAGSCKTSSELEVMLRNAVLSAPSFTLRGGTNEILRNIIGRDLTAAR